MNRMQAIGNTRAVGASHGFPLPDRGYSPRHTASRTSCSKTQRDGDQRKQKLEQSLERATRHRLSSARNDHPIPIEEPVPPGASSRFHPDIITFTLGRVDSSHRFLRLPDILAVCAEVRCGLSKSLESLDPSQAELIAERANGKRPNQPRIAFMPLASVGHPQADGRLLAMGLALPNNIALKERLAEAIERVSETKLALGNFGTWRIEPFAARSLPRILLPETWTGQPKGATDWATITPIVLDEQMTDGAAAYDQTSHLIRLACRHEGLPEPCEIIVTPISAHFGAPQAEAFPRFQQQGSKRPHRHAILIFPEPVRGPILLGPGRHSGYGLCRPMPAEA